MGSSYGTPWSAWRATLVGALRLLVFVGFCLTIAPVAVVLGLLSDAALRWDPHTSSAAARFLMAMRVRFLRRSCRIVSRICGIRVEVAGDLPKHRSGLLLANHLSYLDVVAIGSVFPCGFVAKKEISRWPLIGSIARGLGCVFLDRDDLGSRVSALKQLRRRLVAMDMCVFPEGTTTSQRKPCPDRWRTGQAWAAWGHHAGVVAIAVSYSSHERAVWVDDAPFLPHLVKLLRTGPMVAKLSLTTLQLPALELGQAREARAVSLAAHDAVAQLCEASLAGT